MDHNKLQSDEKFILILVGIGAAVVISLTLILSVFDIVRYQDRIPHCEEDEVLVAKDFPYTNAENLKCVNVEVYERGEN